MKDFLPFIVVGVTTGSVYALAGVGLVLTFKTSGIFNFAHGTQAALAAYIMFEFRERNGWPWPLAAAATLVLVGVVGGLLLERLAQVLAGATAAARVAATVGLLVGIQGAIVGVFGPAVTPMRYFLPTTTFSVGDVNIRYEQLIVMLLALGAVVALYLLFARTRLGAGMQAVVDDPALFALQGTNPATVRRAAWIIGSSFAAVSGMLLAPTIGLEAGILTLLVFYAFGAAAVGGFNNLVRTYAGGLVIGVVAALLTKEVGANSPFGALPTTLPFIVLFAALLLYKRGSLVEQGSRVVRRALPPLTFPPAVRIAAVAAGAVVACSLPALIEGRRLALYTMALAYLVIFVSLALLVRTSGQISLCQITFAGIGAVASAHAVHAGVPWPLAVALGGMAAVPAGALVALPAVRLSGVYLAIATFGFGILVQRLFYTRSFFFGLLFQLPAPRPSFGRSDTDYYFVVLAVAVAMCLLVVGVRRSRLGRILRALADSPRALDAHGANTNLTKLLVFCLAAFVAGIGGALVGPVTGTASGLAFDFSVSFLLLSVLFIAGRQPLLGPVVAAALFVVVPGYIESDRLLQWQPVLFGAGALIATMYGGQPVLAPLRHALRTSRRTADKVRSTARRAGPATAPVAAASAAVEVGS